MGTNLVPDAHRSVFASLAILLLVSLFFGCTKAVCTGNGRLKSTTLSALVEGPSLSLSVLDPSGAPLNDFLNATLSLKGFAERERYYEDGAYLCDWTAEIEDDSQLVQRMLIEDFDCTVNTGSYMHNTGAEVSFVNVNYTHPSYPLFWLSNTFYTTSEDFDIFPNNDTTFVDPGKVYKWSYRKEKVKWTYEISHFPFIGSSNSSAPSYFQFHWELSMGVGPQTRILTSDEPYVGYFRVTQNLPSSYREVLLEFEKAFIFDGVPYLQQDPTPLGVTHNVSITDGIPLIGPFPTGIPFCASYHWNTSIYDPAVGALFGSITSPETTTPQQVKDNRAAKIAGAVIGSVLAAIVITIVLLVIFVPSVRYFFRPYSERGNKSTSDHASLELRDTIPSASTEATPKSSGWSRSSKPTSL